MCAMLDRQALTDLYANRFGSREGFWITVNSKSRVRDRCDPKIPDRFLDFEKDVADLVTKLNEYCYGRRFLRKELDAQVDCLASFEVGGKDGLVHAHVVALHRGDTNRSPAEIQKHLEHKFGKKYDIQGSEAFVRVDGIKNVRDRIWYMTKQTAHFQRMFGVPNFTQF